MDAALLVNSLDEGTKKLIKSPALPDEDRSAVAASVIFKLMRKGVSDATIEAVFDTYPIGDRYTNNRTKLVDDIQRPRRKFELRQEEVTPEIGVSLMDFYAFLPVHKFIFAPTGEMWVGASVNARVGRVSRVPSEYDGA